MKIYYYVIKSIIISVFCSILIISCIQKKAELIRDEHNQIIFTKIKNHDKSIKDKLVLTIENVHDVIKYIKNNYPDYDFRHYDIDDLGIELFVENFNDEQEFCMIYISGSDEFSGYSTVFSWLNGFLDIEEPRLFSYHFWIDEQYSDKSGIQFGNYVSFRDNTSEMLMLWKKKYNNSDNYYWHIVWPLIFGEDEIYEVYSGDEKIEILITFLMQFRKTIAFENIDMVWFENIYTDIEGNQQIIGDILSELP